MHYDVVIIGAGLSGLAAGIRLAHYNRRVCILERHSVPGGLNSCYRQGGHAFDVGLHAMTNWPDPADRAAPLNRLYRQLRLDPAAFALVPQQFSQIRFPCGTLRFGNRFAGLDAEVARLFPEQLAGFRALAAEIEAYDAFSFETVPTPAAERVARHITDARLRDMLFCPLMFYGNPAENEMEFGQFCIMFRSIFLEGLCRPVTGVRRVLGVLLRRYRAGGGELRLRCGVRTVRVEDGTVRGVELDDGRVLTADAVLSCAGYIETLRLCDPVPAAAETHPPGQLAFTESIFVLDRPAADFGHGAAIVFFNHAERFTFAAPSDPVDFRSGVLCCNTNFDFPAGRRPEPQARLTHLASPRAWAALEGDAYSAAKQRVLERQRQDLEAFMPGIGAHIVGTDMFTPRTVTRYTGHINGAVYGSPVKIRDGVTPVRNLFICGTDQGFLGITGAMLSGVAIGNRHLLRAP